jgi:hypothetical protein
MAANSITKTLAEWEQLIGVAVVDLELAIASYQSARARHDLGSILSRGIAEAPKAVKASATANAALTEALRRLSLSLVGRRGNGPLGPWDLHVDEVRQWVSATVEIAAGLEALAPALTPRPVKRQARRGGRPPALTTYLLPLKRQHPLLFRSWRQIAQRAMPLITADRELFIEVFDTATAQRDPVKFLEERLKTEAKKRRRPLGGGAVTT